MNKFGLLCLLGLLSPVDFSSSKNHASESEALEKIQQIRWVDYSPPSADPTRGIEATEDAVRKDLSTLRKAHFTGIVTYGSSGILGKQLLVVAQQLRFEGIIVGIWDPQNRLELDAAKKAAQLPIVVGVCVGNEGLMTGRYSFATLSKAVAEVRNATKKPVTTTETVDQYNSQLLALGDWVFPNAHPYFSNIVDPESAVAWTKARFDEIKNRTGKLVLLKEVGLPTAGDAAHPLSEEAQCKYYDSLANSRIRFVYFEAFDQPWKMAPQVEPHWGVFNSDGSPKLLARHLIGGSSCLLKKA